jgi:hypothetical protein
MRDEDDDDQSSRGQSGGSSGQDDVGIPSRSAPASSREELIGALERALGRFKKRDSHELFLNLALGGVERAIRRWRAEDRSSRWRSPPVGRPLVLEGDVELVLALREANPGSDCKAEFAKAIGRKISKHRVRARFREASREIAREERGFYEDCS